MTGLVYFIFFFSAGTDICIIFVMLLMMAELQIRVGIEDNSKIIFLFLNRNMYCNPHQNSLGETVLIMGCNIHFKEVMWKIIPKLSLLPLLIWRTE